MQETETDEPVETAVIEFLDLLSLVINDQKLAPNYGVGEFLMHLCIRWGFAHMGYVGSLLLIHFQAK